MRCCAVNQFRNHTYSNSIVQAHLVDLWKLVPWFGLLGSGIGFYGSEANFSLLSIIDESK